MPTNWFDERIAGSYEARWPELFDPAVVDPVVRFLAELAGGNAAIPVTIGDFATTRVDGSFRLDLMARLAGMTLRERSSGWKREPFTADSRQHVSVWEKRR